MKRLLDYIAFIRKENDFCSGSSPSPPNYDPRYPFTFANFFAANFLMPETLVKLNFHRCYNPKKPFAYYGKGKDYCFTAYGATQIIRINSYSHFCFTLAKPLTSFFSNVSKTSLGLRIHNLGLVLNYSGEEILEETLYIGNVVRNLV